MKSKAVLLGHPVHPMLIPFPIAFLTGAMLFDAAGWLFGNPAWWTTGGHLAAVGIATALLAAVPGLVDYVYTVPPKSSGKTRATRHMATVLFSVALFGLAWMIRRADATSPQLVIIGLEAAGVAFVAVGGYMGGTLVTRNLVSVDHRYANAGKWREETIAPSSGGPIIVATHDELKINQMKLLRVGDKRIALARTEQGYVAFEDRCTHRGGSLAGGVMACGTVQCLWHGSHFDVRTGAVKGGPATNPVAVYRVAEDNGDVKLLL
jgi:nitrite reductase/ring-hydroxylating ferredoxin subunit/uncharacterized membrane protein